VFYSLFVVSKWRFYRKWIHVEDVWVGEGRRGGMVSG